jgi:hypothetical protein
MPSILSDDLIRDEKTSSKISYTRLLLLLVQLIMGKPTPCLGSYVSLEQPKDGFLVFFFDASPRILHHKYQLALLKVDADIREDVAAEGVLHCITD